MIARLIFAVLAVGLAVAQQEFIMYTNGTGGVECGKYHRCITKATCEKIDGLDMCECDPSLLKGNAKLHCLPSEDYNVWIQNDPHIKNFHKEFASLLTPCRYRVLNLVFVPEVDTTAVVELFGENMLFKGGEYFLTKLTLSITVDMGVGLMKQIMEFKGDVDKDIFGAGYNYTLIGQSLDTTLEVEGDAEPVPFEEGPFMGYTMDVEKDNDNNLLTVMIKSLGISLLFRPPSLDDRLDNKLLPMVPGAVLNVDKEHWKFLDIQQSQYDISSWPNGPSLEDKATEMNIPKPLLVQYLMLNNSMHYPVIDDSDICTDISTIFLKQCNTTEYQLDMLRQCVSIYAEKTFLECLTERNTLEEYLTLHKDFFRRCEITMCLQSAAECELMKKEMPLKTKCPLPKKIEELDCNGLM